MERESVGSTRLVEAEHGGLNGLTKQGFRGGDLTENSLRETVCRVLAVAFLELHSDRWAASHLCRDQSSLAGGRVRDDAGRAFAIKVIGSEEGDGFLVRVKPPVLRH